MRKWNKKTIIACLTFLAVQTAVAQTLTLDSCRQMALRANKQLNIGELKKDIAANTRKAARTAYLPKINAIGAYAWTSKEISLLNNLQKNTLGNLGTNAIQGATGFLTNSITSMVQEGKLSPQEAAAIQQKLQSAFPTLQALGNETGEKIKDAFRTDTRNMWMGSVMLTQPLFMGGAITAANRMADINERMALTQLENQQTQTLYDVDEVYWLVVSLKNKQRLAEKFDTLVGKLNADVQAMIREGIATKADGLKVAVKKNESEMTLSQVNDGLAMARMLLCQKCGLPLDSDIILADEESTRITPLQTPNVNNNDVSTAIEHRAEIKLLEDATELTRQVTRLTRAAYLPQAALTGGYMTSNPNLYNGFSKHFGGMWNIGVMLRIPVWNWFEGVYKVRATKAATVIAEYELSEAKELIELQVNQCKYKAAEAIRRLQRAQNNIRSAEENLRCANIGFKEGVMESTDVIAAQAAWQQAQSQKIDAEIEVRMSQLALNKALGIMQ